MKRGPVTGTVARASKMQHAPVALRLVGVAFPWWPPLLPIPGSPCYSTLSSYIPKIPAISSAQNKFAGFASSLT